MVDEADMAASRVVLVDMAVLLMAATAATKATEDMAGTKDTVKIRATAMAPKAVMAVVLLADTANKAAKEASESGTDPAASKITTSQITATVAATAVANKAAMAETMDTANKTLAVAEAAVDEAEAVVAADTEDTTNTEGRNLSTTSCQPIAVIVCLSAVFQILSERRTSPCSFLLQGRLWLTRRHRMSVFSCF